MATWVLNHIALRYGRTNIREANVLVKRLNPCWVQEQTKKSGIWLNFLEKVVRLDKWSHKTEFGLQSC